MLLHYESCTDLSISLSLDKSGPSQAWSRCVAFIRKSSALRHFTLSHTPLSIGNFLRLSFYGLCLERLCFVDCNLSGHAIFGLIQWLRILLSSTSLHPPVRDKSANSSGSNKFRGWRSRTFSHSSGLRALHTNITVPDYTKTTTTLNDANKPSVWELKLGLMNNKLTATDAEAIVPIIRHQLLIPEIPKSKIIKSDSAYDDKHKNDSLSDATMHNPCAKFEQMKKSNSLSSTLCDVLPVGGIGYLSELDLSHNNLGDDGLGILCTGLLQCYRNRLRERPSAASNQEATDKTVSCSSSNDSVSESNVCCTETIPMKVCGLERLCLVNNNIGIQGMQSLALVLMQTPESLVSLVGGLVSLDLSYNSNIGDKGVEILSEGLIRNHSLRELYLRSVQMSFPGIFALSSFLSESKCLTHLDIRNNDLDLASLMALSKTLFINKTMISLFSDARRLVNCQSDMSDDRELIDSLIRNIESNLRRNRSELEVDSVNRNNIHTVDTNCDTTTPTSSYSNLLIDAAHKDAPLKQSNTLINTVPIVNNDDNNMSESCNHSTILNHEIPVRQTVDISITSNFHPIDNNLPLDNIFKVNKESEEKIIDNFNSITDSPDSISELTSCKIDSRKMNLINVTSMNEKISELSIDEFMNKSGKEEETISSPHNSKDIEVSVQNSAYCLNDISKGVIADLSDSKHESLDSYDYDLQKSSSFDELKGQNHVDCTHSDNVNNNTSIKTVIKQKSKKNKKISQHNKHTPSSSSSSSSKSHPKVNTSGV
ncbi:unnamed protein product [Heterobilharzia americana]|nr:unnamed protein product [Heterobilharzia americana]